MPRTYHPKPKEHDHEHEFPGCSITPDAVEFGRAMERFKRETGRKFPTCSDVLTVVKSLGYAKSN